MTRDKSYNIFGIKTGHEFEESALRIFRLQASSNKIYRQYIDNIGRDVSSVSKVEDIPFLPISAFKYNKVKTGKFRAGRVFSSSGTTGSERSYHYVKDLNLYRESFNRCFNLFYDDPFEYALFALLPSYIERKDSSLVYMVSHLMKGCGNVKSGFYMDDHEELIFRINEQKNRGGKIILIGVSFALLDLAERFSPDLSGVIVMETGGMKGRRRELTRDELHEVLSRSFNVPAIHSEYGMTELLSQAYSSGEGRYNTPPWMKLLIRDPHDPFSYLQQGSNGGINIIDLANIHSCSFIETSDLGTLYEDGSFSVSGRFDESDIRGCNLMTGR